MAKIEMYTTIPCGYCDKAKEIFASKNLPYTEYNILLNQNYFKEMIKRYKGKRKSLLRMGKMVTWHVWTNSRL